ACGASCEPNHTQPSRSSMTERSRRAPGRPLLDTATVKPCRARVVSCFIALLPPSPDRGSNLGRYPLCDHDQHEDQDEDRRDLRPLQAVDAGVELQSDAARTDESYHGRLADVDVPTVDADACERRRHLRHDAICHYL